MGVDDCQVDLESVTVRCSGVVCEVCDWWLHTACVGLKVSSKMLSHKIIVFLCDKCLEEAKERMMDRKEDKIDQTTQTKTTGTSSTYTQTEDAEAGGTQTIHTPQPQEDKAIQSEREQRPKRGSTLMKPQSTSLGTA